MHDRTSLRLTPDIQAAVDTLMRDGVTQSGALRILIRAGIERIQPVDDALRRAAIQEGIMLGLQRLKQHVTTAIDAGVIVNTSDEA